MPKMNKKSMNIAEIEAFMQNVPEDRTVVANGLLDKMKFLNNLLSELAKQIEAGDTSAQTVKSYNDTIQRYGVICKQLVAILPPSVGKPENDSLLNFVKDGYKK